MKAQLKTTKNDTVIHSGVYEMRDADGFGKACSIAWSALRARQLDEEASIGALMEHLDRGVVDLLTGAQITVSAIG
jgi:hypothetical protein